MPFVSQTARRSILQEATIDENIPSSSFGETFAASVGTVIDEDLMISSFLNREGWENRRELITQRINEGVIDRDSYIEGRGGAFDYNRAATDLADPLIKTDNVLEAERTAMLKGRREYAQDVIARGSGIAQFLGMANAFMLDPINIATMGIAVPATAAKSISIMGRALLTAKSAAAISVATELAIQPFVFEHKQDIESPYTYKDALANIAGAAIGAGAFGGVLGGVSGYLRKARAGVEAQGAITNEVDQAMQWADRMADTIDYGRANRPTHDLTMVEYEKFRQGEYDSLGQAANKAVKELEAEVTQLEKGADTLKQFIQSEGGLNKKLMVSEGIDPDLMKAGGRKPVFRANGGGSIDDLTEKLNEINFKGGNLTSNDVLDLVEGVARGDDAIMDSNIASRVQFNKDQIDQLGSSADEEVLASVFEGTRKRDIDSDIDFMEALEVERDRLKRPTVTTDQYAEPKRQPASNASVTSRQQFMLDDAGASDDFNLDMQRYRELKNPTFLKDGEVVSTDDVMKSIDNDLEGIESVLSCTYA